MSLKPVTFQGAENFKANLYALEVRSRFVDQGKTDGYYAGYGNELSATVASNTIKIGSGAFVVQGRMCEVENSESVSVVIENGKYGVIIARIETKPATNGANFSIIARTGVSKDALKAALTQEDTYQYSAETTNKVYELPLYYFSMSNGAITLGAKEIKAIKEITDINNAAKNAVSIAQTASATASSATQIAGVAKTIAERLSPDENGVLKYNSDKIVLSKKPFYVATVGTAYEYTLLSGDTFPTPGKTYEVIYEDNGVAKSFIFNFPAKGSTSTVELYFCLMYNVTRSLMDNTNFTDGTKTYKTMKWVISYTDKTVKHSKVTSGQCSASSPYFKGLYEIFSEEGAQ